MSTDTWTMLAGHKGNEGHINMYDLKDYFVVEWTKSTGCSVALLMNPDPTPVDLMISHAWAGSVRESLSALRSAVYDEGVPSTTSIFWCTFCMYQCEDGAGLSIAEQLSKEPFAQIIRSAPSFGMRVVHTSRYEVYQRLWTVHEVDEASHANLDIKGLCDFAKFQIDSLECALQVKTSKAMCREEDRLMLNEKICARGGYERLDKEIAEFRLRMLREFKSKFQWRDEIVSVTAADEQHAQEGIHDMHGQWDMEKECQKESFWHDRMQDVRQGLSKHKG